MNIPIGSSKTLYFAHQPKDDYTDKLYLRNHSLEREEDVIYSSTIDTTANGITIEAVVTPTRNWAYGVWNYHLLREKGQESEILEQGTLCIIPSIKDEPRKSQTQKDYEVLEDVIRNYGSKPIQSYTISGRQVNRLSLTDIIKLRNQTLRKLNYERRSLGLPTIQSGIPRTFRLRGIY